MKLNKILPYAFLAASPLFISCEDDNDGNNGDDNNNGGTSVQCSTKITSSDAPNANDVFILLEGNDDDTDLDSLVDISGSDQSWDFSTLTAESDADTIHFRPASDGDASGDFPSADFAFIDEEDDNEMYIEVKSHGLDIIGANFSEDEEVDVEITNSISYIPYILEMGKTINDEFVLTATTKDTLDTIIGGIPLTDIPVDLEVVQTNSNEFNVDGCGTVTTPFGEYNCLRYVVEPGESEIEGTISGNNALLGGDFSIAIPEEELDGEEMEFNVFEGTTYFWINKETGFPVVIVEIDENGDAVSVQYLKD